MYNQTFGLVMVLLFSGLLFFLLKQKKRYFEYYPHSFMILTWGAVSVVFAGVMNIGSFFLNQEGSVFANNWGKIFQTLEIFGYLAGGGLILIGFLKWGSSLLEVKKNATRRLRQLACLNSLLSVINHHQGLDEILKESLPILLNIMGYRMGVIFKPTFNSSQMTVVAHAGVPAGRLYALYDLHSKNIWYKDSGKSKEVATTSDVKSLPEYGTLFTDSEEICSFACVPIKFCGRLLGLMGLYDLQLDRFSYQEVQFLTTVGEILGLSVKQTLTSERNKKRRDYVSAMENMLKISQEATSLEEAFPKISAELKRIIDFEHLSLAFEVGSGKNVRCISMGSSGGVLVDKRVRIHSGESLIGKVMSSGEVWLDRHIDSSESFSEDSISKAFGTKSRIILPLRWEESTYGALSFGHSEPNFYSFNHAKWLRPFTLALSYLVFQQVQKEKSKRAGSLNRSLYEFERRLVGEDDFKALVEDVATSLTRDLQRSFARVMLLDRQKDQLLSCASHQIRTEGIELRKEERFSLDNLPWHRLTLEAKRPMLINQDDPEAFMSKKEAGLILDERVNSALLVPLLLNDSAVGVISVGEMRTWDREPLTEEEIVFARHKANQLSVALKKGLLLRLNERLKERLKSFEKPKESASDQTKGRRWFSDLAFQINSPLTLIRGSAELLRLSESNLGTDSLKYLKNIENGVDRIHKCLE